MVDETRILTMNLNRATPAWLSLQDWQVGLMNWPRQVFYALNVLPAAQPGDRFDLDTATLTSGRPGRYCAGNRIGVLVVE
ncbi:MAG: hypothetical protein OXF88_02770 [Rhodobacteraceae bacterium]|nr:hypothetical protein [Paracoccaceae bacterium]